MCVLRADQQAQVSLCAFAIGAIRRMTYPKSRVNIVSNALWGTGPAGSGAIAVTVSFVVCEGYYYGDENIS